MTTQIIEIDAESKYILRSMIYDTYLDGECYALAETLSEGLGWSMIGLMDGSVVRHAAVRSPDGRYLDARGFVSEAALGEPFGIRPPYSLREVGEADLARRGEPALAREMSRHRARMLAEAAWPDLPWKQSLALRVRNFCDELEALSRKHGLWIRAPYPAARPTIAQGDEDERGYTMQPTDDGITFVVDRYYDFLA